MSHLLSDQAIPIIHDRLESWPAENCCFCRNATHWWTSLRDRTPGQQVACCQACAKSRAASEVPSKTAWCDAEKTTEGRRRADQSKPDDQRCFYVLDARSPVGNCALWWRPERSGYTTELGEAGLYTEAETKRMRSTDIPFHRDIIAKLEVRHVRLDRMREAGLSWTIEDAP